MRWMQSLPNRLTMHMQFGAGARMKRRLAVVALADRAMCNGPAASLAEAAGPVRCRSRAGYFGTRAQSVELMLVLHPEMTEVSGTKEAPRLMTLLRTVTPTKVPE